MLISSGKKLVIFFLLFLITGHCVLSQPGNGNGNGNGPPCGQPPCGGPNQNVPIDEKGLLFIAVALGMYKIIRQTKKKKVLYHREPMNGKNKG
jgi:hypothetical protein